MIKKSFLGLFMLCCLAITALAQSGEIKGVVKIQDAEKKETPVANAEVIAYRIDADSGKLETVTTNEKGEFVLTGATSGHLYAITASVAGADARIYPEAKSGENNVIMILPVGTGSKLSEEDVRETAKEANKQKKMTPEQIKKAEEERKKMVAEVEARNKKVLENNATINKLIKEGNKLFESEKFNEAILKYDEGYTLQPDFIGSAPVFLNNKGIALRKLVYAEYVSATKTTDPTEKAAKNAKIKEYLLESLKSTKTSYELLKSAKPIEITNQVSFDENKHNSLQGITETIDLMASTKNLDDSTDVKLYFDEYFDTEKDAAKKAKSQALLAELLLAKGEIQGAIEACRKAINISNNQPDALYWLGIALYSKAAESSDKALFQESANNLKKFVDVAPANHSDKANAESTLNELKEQFKITPQKIK